MPSDARHVPYDPEGILWQLAEVCDSREGGGSMSSMRSLKLSRISRY